MSRRRPVRSSRCRRPRPQGGRRAPGVTAPTSGGAGSPSSLRSPIVALGTAARHRLRRRRPPDRDDHRARRARRASCRPARRPSRRSRASATLTLQLPVNQSRDHGDRLLRGVRRRARPDADRHAGEPGPAEARRRTRSSAAARARRAGTCSRAGRGRRPRRSNVGAAPGTDVYSPVDGTIVGIEKVIARRQGVRARRSTSSRRYGPVARSSRSRTSPPIRRSPSAPRSRPAARSSATLLAPLEGRDAVARAATRTTRATTC